ncbi:MAG: hypothetical protein V2I33_19760 [Kangiellaceae bacterium]|jgi:ribosome-interacting GTPase 1|nr:hypothetical protein [Kangiellaceae bacterium]
MALTVAILGDPETGKTELITSLSTFDSNLKLLEITSLKAANHNWDDVNVSLFLYDTPEALHSV